MQEILLNVETKEIRMARLRNGTLQDLVLERKKERQLTGNVYRGRVTNILENIQSSFIDIDEFENGFIHISDIVENRKKFEDLYEMDFELVETETKSRSKSKPKSKPKEEIDKIMKIDQPVLVQVLKEPIGSKGARLTSKISIAGRYLVLLPNSPHRGVSKRIEESSDRSKLKKLIRSFEMPKEMGLICRTASRYASLDLLIAEAHDLLATWEGIVEKYHKSKGPSCLYQDSDIIKRAVMLAIDKRYDRLLIDNYAVYRRCKAIYKTYSGEHSLRLEFYRDNVPMFERFNVEREIEKALRHKIWLPSGGYLFFEHTEAMCTIDVNSGRSTKNEKDLEETLVRINLEAAEEISRQLRIRNLGGLIICDFIDMRMRKNQRRVVDYLKDCMKEDSAKCTVLGMSEFGLIEMTRQRNKESLKQMTSTDCPYCHGGGWIKNFETISIEIERELKKLIVIEKQFAIKLTTHPEVNKYLEQVDKAFLKKFAEKLNAHLDFESDDSYHLNEFHFFSSTNGSKLDT
ncbi:MAG: Ribonuclease G [Chlamydiae bacterium]|nr:Ribonuclease G [Chlamydiota bacterium]